MKSRAAEGYALGCSRERSDARPAASPSAGFSRRACAGAPLVSALGSAAIHKNLGAGACDFS